MADERTSPSTERVDVKTGFKCNNRCIFCVQGNKRDLYGNKSTEEVKEILRGAVQDSDSIVFTGGEVTIRPDFIELVRFARDQGFRRIQVQTNGRMLAYKKFARDTVEAGANEFSPAVHGHTAKLHDDLTRCEGSFEQSVRSIRNLKELGQRVITNSVITRSNFRHLPELAALLVRLGVDQYQFAFVHALGTAQEHFSQVVPRMALIEPYVKRGIQVGVRAGRIVLTEAIPYCFMTGYEEHVAERFMPRTKIFDAKSVVEDYTNYRWTEGKAKGPPCEECTWNSVCEGPWKDYAEGYGWDEFIPRKDDVTITLPESRGKGC